MTGKCRRWLSREVRVGFWDQVRAGLSVDRAAIASGVSPASGRRLFEQAGGVITNAPVACSGRLLSWAEWELARNSTAAGYRASTAQHTAEHHAKRPKPAKLTTNPALHARVQQDLRARWSPEQIAARLKRDFPDQPRMHVTHETICQALYVQARGGLHRELAACLRTGRAVRTPQRTPDGRRTRQGKIAGMVPISERPRRSRRPGPSPGTGKAT
ncbi:hypothetical protein SAMN04489732_103157 [Amycolatopsis saalfeldensis]|uniref:Uncharacterized protein n=1 Tax=Amycolatopsis saalfeldensis TaxID=394193 RepID=A0A1H8UAK9_9PSEU|nr:hypothetical protein [Amycolatopsis saalfeldensis]SEP00077.1 hypothetical protein SAMN04489732_103157 [Amycolatopsis saalfeldensis]